MEEIAAFPSPKSAATGNGTCLVFFAGLLSFDDSDSDFTPYGPVDAGARSSWADGSNLVISVEGIAAFPSPKGAATGNGACLVFFAGLLSFDDSEAESEPTPYGTIGVSPKSSWMNGSIFVSSMDGLRASSSSNSDAPGDDDSSLEESEDEELESKLDEESESDSDPDEEEPDIVDGIEAASDDGVKKSISGGGRGANSSLDDDDDSEDLEEDDDVEALEDFDRLVFDDADA